MFQMRSLFCLLLVGCSAAAVTRDEPVRPSDLPGPFSKLGASCGSELPTGSSFICGRDHRIASLTLPFQPLPRGGTIRSRKFVPNEPMAMSSSAIEIDGPRIWVESGCRYCRMATTSTTVFDLRLIDDEGLAQQQQFVGLPRTPLLRTATAWNDATSGAGWESHRFD
jgi:hypothetical protein